MSISFPCPECRAQIEVADEFAGHAGQCPRCSNVLVIPSPNQPATILATVESTPSPREEPSQKRAEREAAPPRRRRTRPVPKQPAGPIWPWVVGFFGAVVLVTLLISSFSVLVFWRRAPEPTRVFANDQNNRVTVGRLEGHRAIMQNGVFQVRSELTKNDPHDLDNVGCHCKRFEIDLRANQPYTFEMDSNQFNCEVRCENPANNEIAASDGKLGRNARLDHRPRQSMVYHVYVTSTDPATGPFALTIREQHRPKPMVP